MISRKLRVAVVAVLALVLVALTVFVAGQALAGRMGSNYSFLPCPPGQAKKIIQEAGSCLGDYKNRKANEPIAFCVRTRTVCEPH